MTARSQNIINILGVKLGPILKSLMRGSNTNASQLARHTNIAQPIIHRILTEQNKNPKIGTIIPLARHYMLNLSQLIGESPLPEDRAFSLKISLARQGWNRVPLISWKDATAWPAALPHYQTSENAVYMSTDAHITPSAYGLSIHGSAMEPIYRTGTTIIVEPKRDAQDQDLVLMHLGNREEASLKQIIMDGHSCYLKPLNPELENTRLRQVTPDDRFLGVVVQAKIDY